MNNEQHLSEDDLVLFALQFLPEDRMREAAEHLKSCGACRTQTAQLQGDLVAYAMTAGATAPPAEARERLLRQVAKEPKMVAPAEPARAAEPEQSRLAGKQMGRSRESRSAGTFAARQSRSLSLEAAEEEEAAETERRPRRAPWVLAWTGWAVAAGFAFTAGLELHQRQQIQNAAAVQAERMAQNDQNAQRAQDVLATLTAASAQQIALRPAVAVAPKKGETAAPAGSSPEALAAYLSQRGALVFIATHLEPVADGKTYELWLLPADPARSPIPAGTFRPDAQGNASVIMPQLPSGVAAKGFGVTVENAGGATTPTLPIVLSGT